MASSLPKIMRAVTIQGKKASVAAVPLPQLRPDYVLCKVGAIALNPTDWKHIAGERAAAGSIAGCDFAGTVVEVGSSVTKSFKTGDRVAAVTHGANFSQKEDGAFAEYCVAKGDLLMHIPANLSFEEAATFPLGTGTVGQGLYQKALKLNLPTEPSTSGETVLIYGGSSATGSLAIQLAKLSGYRVITTCSPHNHAFVTALGADAVYDYKEAGVGKRINDETNDSLKLAWDTISTQSSAQICAEALSSDATGAKYGSILPVKLSGREDVETTFTLLYTVFGEAYTKGGRETPASPEDLEFGKKWYAIVEKLLAEGKLKTHPEKIGERGLEGALQGMQDMKEDKVSGQKLVYRVADTPQDSKAEVEL